MVAKFAIIIIIVISIVNKQTKTNKNDVTSWILRNVYPSK